MPGSSGIGPLEPWPEPKGPQPPDPWDLGDIIPAGTTSGAGGDTEAEPEGSAVVQAEPAAPPPSPEEIRREKLKAMEPVEVQQSLKKAMANVLRLHKAYKTAHENWHQAPGVGDHPAMEWPATDDEDEVRQSVERHITASAAWREASNGFAKLVYALRNTKLEYARAFVELDELVDDCLAARRDFDADETFQAAREVVWLVRRVEADEAPVAVPEIQPESHERRLQVEQLKQRLLEFAVLFCTYAHSCEQYEELKKRSNALNRPYLIEEPVRPIDEEVQRYLGDMERFMSNRRVTGLKLHEQTMRMMSLEKELITALAAFNASMLEVDLATAPFLTQAIAGTAKSLQLIASNKLFTMSDAKKLFGVDMDQKPKPTRAESAELVEVRKLMRDIGFAMGRLNEATRAHRATEATPPASVSLRGAGSFATWEECLAWRAKKAEEEEVAKQANLTRATKLELLKDSIQAAKTELATGRSALRRHVMSRLKRLSRVEAPCDELRDLYKASDWMCRYPGTKDEDNSFGYLITGE